jgi:uncharacterized protein (DUF983 family)
MNVTRGQIVLRGLTNRCPNCGGRTLFQPGRPLTLNESCPTCGIRYEKDEGFYLGAMSLNYGLTLVGALTPVALLWYGGVLGGRTAVGLALALTVIVPVVLYRSTRSWQLMLYYFFFPQHLPASRRPLGVEDENV